MQLLITVEAPNIKLTENDNAVQLRGKTGQNSFEDKSYMKDDPELNTKLSGLIDEMADYQRDRLEAFTGPESPAMDEFDSKLEQLRSEAQTIIEKQQEV